MAQKPHAPPEKPRLPERRLLPGLARFHGFSLDLLIQKADPGPVVTGH